MYVWVDALGNYLTALGYPDKTWASDFWPPAVQVIGKDVLRFHAIIWLAMLLALGLELPRKLLVHGHVLSAGNKMSKTLGNVVDPLALIDLRGADAFRYYFARHVPTFDDGDFTEEKFVAAYNGELANDLGNLVSRLANMIKKYEIPKFPDSKVDDFVKDLPPPRNYAAEIAEKLDNFEIDRATETLWAFIQSQNKFIDQQQPWLLAKTDREKLENVLNLLWRNLTEIGELLTPFLPDTAGKIREIFGGEELPDGILILFPRVEN
jgi:methionyl-tRNA synthetase